MAITAVLHGSMATGIDADDGQHHALRIGRFLRSTEEGGSVQSYRSGSSISYSHPGGRRMSIGFEFSMLDNEDEQSKRLTVSEEQNVLWIYGEAAYPWLFRYRIAAGPSLAYGKTTITFDEKSESFNHRDQGWAARIAIDYMAHACCEVVGSVLYQKWNTGPDDALVWGVGLTANLDSIKQML